MTDAGTEETLRDGRGIQVRPLRPDDAERIEALWRRLDAGPGAGSPTLPMCRRSAQVTWLCPGQALRRAS